MDPQTSGKDLVPTGELSDEGAVEIAVKEEIKEEFQAHNRSEMNCHFQKQGLIPSNCSADMQSNSCQTKVPFIANSTVDTDTFCSIKKEPNDFYSYVASSEVNSFTENEEMIADSTRLYPKCVIKEEFCNDPSTSTSSSANALFITDGIMEMDDIVSIKREPEDSYLEANSIQETKCLTQISAEVETSQSNSEKLVSNKRGNFGLGSEIKPLVEKSFGCALCPYKTKWKRDLSRHSRTHSGVKPFKCSSCPYQAIDKGQLQKHTRIHTGEKPFKCSSCPYRSNWKEALLRHSRMHIAPPEESSLDQQLLGDKANCSANSGNLVREQTGKLRNPRTQAMEKAFHCPLCPYRAKWNRDLIRHSRIHTGEKPYKCNICPYEASEKGHLQRHARIHTGEKPFECNLCPYRTNWKEALLRHSRMHSGEKPFECSSCPYRTGRKEALLRHSKVHRGKQEREREHEEVNMPWYGQPHMLEDL